MPKKKKAKPPNPFAVHAARRNATAAPMKHRLEPKGGAANEQAEFIERFHESKWNPDEHQRFCGSKDGYLCDCGDEEEYD